MPTIDKSGFSHNPKIVPQSIWDQTAKLVPQSHMSLECGSGTNREFETRENADPLACPNVIRLALSERASRALSDAGECFAIIGRGSYPSDPGRMVIYCQAVPMAVAAAACGVAMGSHRAVKIKVAKPTPPAPSPPSAT